MHRAFMTRLLLLSTMIDIPRAIATIFSFMPYWEKVIDECLMFHSDYKMIESVMIDMAIHTGYVDHRHQRIRPPRGAECGPATRNGKDRYVIRLFLKQY